MVESKSGGASVMTGVCMITVAQDATGKNTIACLGENALCGRKEILSVDLILSERSVASDRMLSLYFMCHGRKVYPIDSS